MLKCILRMLRVLLVCSISCFSAGLFAKPEVTKVLSTLSSKYGDFSQGQLHVYTPKGLGASVAFKHPQGWATIYVYDLNIPQIQTGVVDPIVKQAFQQALDEIEQAYHVTLPLTDAKPCDAQQRIALACFVANGQVFMAKLQQEVDTKVVVTAINGYIVKFRLSGQAELVNGVVTNEFITQVLQDLLKFKAE